MTSAKTVSARARKLRVPSGSTHIRDGYPVLALGAVAGLMAVQHAVILTYGIAAVHSRPWLRALEPAVCRVCHEAAQRAWLWRQRGGQASCEADAALQHHTAGCNTKAVSLVLRSSGRGGIQLELSNTELRGGCRGQFKTPVSLCVLTSAGGRVPSCRPLHSHPAQSIPKAALSRAQSFFALRASRVELDHEPVRMSRPLGAGS
ncbi:hypothetical protein L1887_57190 [Cichorium endivia]|nr:hypothetical protein L1887_57190 [Cichorium endivia]